MPSLNVILVSSVRPELTTAASVTLYRHLVDRSEINLTILPAEYAEMASESFLATALARLSLTRLHRWAAAGDFLLNTRLALERRLPEPRTGSGSTLVLTVATKSGCWIAQRYAARHGLPLVVRFDDWWPDCIDVCSWQRRSIQNRFIALHKTAKVSICISEGMKTALGPHPHAPVVLPIPEAGRLHSPASYIPGTPFKVCYLGNMYDYGPMLADLANRALCQDRIQMEFRGADPQWPDELKQTMRQKGLLHGFCNGATLLKWLEGFNAYLLAMFFKPEQRRRVETCFATKLPDYSSMGQPIVIWAPESAAVVRWARATGAAFCVTDPNPDAVLVALYSLAADASRRAALGRAARHAYQTDFNPENIQSGFMAALETALISSASWPIIR